MASLDEEIVCEPWVTKVMDDGCKQTASLTHISAMRGQSYDGMPQPSCLLCGSCHVSSVSMFSFLFPFSINRYHDLYCRLHRTCPGKRKKLDVSCYERAVLVARQPEKEVLCLGMCDVICNITKALQQS